MYKSQALLLGGASLVSVCSTVLATPTQQEVEQLRSQLLEQGRQIQRLQQALDEQLQRSQADRGELAAQQAQLDALRRKLQTVELSEAAPQSDPALERLAGRGTANESAPAQQAQAPAASPPPPANTTQQNAPRPNAPAQGAPAQNVPKTVGQAPEKPKDTKPPEVAPIFQQPGVLTPKSKFVFEPSFQYAYSTSNRVSVIGFEIFPALLIGVLDIRTANRSSYTATLTGRYGLTNRFEIEGRIPYLYRRETLQTREFLEASFTDSSFGSSGNGVGDLEFTARYQFNEGGMEKPYYVGTLRLKTRTGTDPFEVARDPAFPRDSGRLLEQPTGTGFYGLQPNLTVIYPTDPAVFFGSLSYLWNIKRNNIPVNGGDTLDSVDPGDGIGFNFGMGLALNERASLSLGYEHNIFGKTKISGQIAPFELTTQLGTLLLGYSYKLKPNTNLSLSLGIGVTKDAPDVQLNFRVPMTF